MIDESAIRRREEGRRYALTTFSIIQALHFSSLVVGAVNVKQTECDTAVLNVSLSVWLLSLAAVNLIGDLLFLLFEYKYHGNHESKGHAGTVPMGGMIFMCCVGIPAILFFIITTVFQISWFVVGAIALATVDRRCNSIVYGFSVLTMIVTLVSASCVRLAVWKTSLKR